MAALLAGGPDSLLTAWSSFRVFDAHPNPRQRERVVHLHVARRHDPLAGVRLCRSRVPLDQRDIRQHDGFRVMGLERSLVVVAPMTSASYLNRILYEIEHWYELDTEYLQWLADRFRCARGHRNIVSMLQASGRGETGTDSSLEAITLGIIRMARLPEPLVNFRIDIDGQLRRVDLYWPEYDLVLEVNGWGHRRARARATDAQLRRDLEARGIRVLTITEDQVRNDPTSVVTLLEPMFAELLPVHM